MPSTLGIVASGVQGFSPLELSPALWLDASDATTITSSGSPAKVSQWNDKSGNGYNFTQATGAAQPTLTTNAINGVSALSFDGSDTLTSSSAADVMLSGATGATMFVVQKNTLDPPTVANSTGAPAGKWGTAATSNHFPFTDGVVYSDFGTNARKTAGNPSPSLADPRVAVFSSQANLWRFWIDGGSPVFSTTTNTFAVRNAAVNLGNGGQSFNYVGDLAVVLVFPVVLSATNINSVGNYLAAVWGTTWSAVS